MTEVFNERLDNIKFTRDLWGESLELWTRIKEVCEGVELSNMNDTIKWTLIKNGIYSVKSHYSLIDDVISFPHKFLWKNKIPPRVRIFFCLVLRNNILTKDNPIRRGWIGKLACPFVAKITHIITFSYTFL